MSRNVAYPPWQKRGLPEREEVRPSGQASPRKRRRPRAEKKRWGDWGAERQEAQPAPHPVPAWASTAGRDATGPAPEEPPRPARDPGPARSGNGRSAHPQPPQTSSMGQEWQGPNAGMEGLSSSPSGSGPPSLGGAPGLRRCRPAAVEIRRLSQNRGVPGRGAQDQDCRVGAASAGSQRKGCGEGGLEARRAGAQLPNGFRRRLLAD